MRTKLPALLGSFVFLLALPALADEQVSLRDGSVVRGELVEKVPNDHVTIKLATGEVRRIEWGAIDPSARSSNDPEMATVQVDSDSPQLKVGYISDHMAGVMSVGGRTGYASAINYKWLCVAPCSFKVPMGIQEIIVDGPGYTPAAKEIDIREKDVHVNVRPGSSALRGLGALGIYLGATAIIVGASFAIVGAAVGSTETKTVYQNGMFQSKQEPSLGATFLPLGIGLLAGGTVATAGGIALAIASSTHIEQTPNGPQAKRDDSFMLTWRRSF